MHDIIRAILSSSVYDAAVETPLEKMGPLSDKLGRPVFLKREDLQPVFSFKLRGAYNKLASLTEAEKAKGVICASAGNHAQGLAYSATRMGLRSVIVMPTTTPSIKVEAVKRLGGEVVIHGDAFDDARLHALALCEAENLTFVHPYDDPDVIAGQGTIGVEILRQHGGPLSALYLPIGGGGLAAGVAAYAKFLRPEIKIIGVEPEDAASMKAALAAGRPLPLNEVGIFADGVAVKQAGERTFDILKDTLDDIVTVSTDEICAAIKDIFEHTRAIAEPAGAVSLAGLRKHAPSLQTQGAAVAICSGANINFDRLRHVAERAELGERAEAVLAVTIPEKPGAYRAFIRLLGARAVTEFNYRIAPGNSAHIFVGIGLKRGEAEKVEIIAMLREHGHTVLDLSDNEVAKLHIRYMVGGRVEGLENELLFRFEFPERPGALLKFLEGLAPDWNISLFHYRNHGSDYGRVLVGVQVPPTERDAFEAYLDTLGYPHWDESENPAYAMFLAPA
ncbi:threonine ammonia-lyase, biosynthetic [Pelagibacterium sp. 26DY04]|uniref:threonine ammonia-lyase, biosynthetic n=1 Tax=Pelagibacterium sp. 26DY04 TaxID=2967130 RepID=UPI002815F449|nr:threonine ammonia-lyase, biosynthetic [Pelagibacterium sp. 26DY04]WMT88045.1 threonine ammonia-lyase, biosynthetic [Pelagibacterium sp. 26DY04]